ncbi:OmpA family protein [Aureibacter tunicatorum]|uniref:Outer membrane protein OmpA-like peptidoglycan-associated protein n=1 Tax=Aureibacter tunicatorum TaxID=866807 RepID=A0AAE3XKC4_9BACT|nr:OmpA family protein [Aureibacter tunicatorum]MDR6239391.1 outer membrane protein OmpA-like peptidoglycan-associated protein [Aureibacter tunicatorum]BDD04686.1 hypothetical protein AUTU_21690 [Aureibacter tunicatorum]
MNKTKCHLLFTLIIILFACLIHSPATAKNKHIENTQQQRYTSRPISKLLTFPYLQERSYYYNKKRLSKIEELFDKKDWEALYPKLYDYILEFGVENFYKDSHWLWRFAQLTEQFYSPQDAKDIYRLILKHHRNDLDLKPLIIEFDSLSQTEISQYVDLEYYYELVEFRKHIDTLRPPMGIRQNMGHYINSRKSEYGPSLNADNDIFIFTSKRNKKRVGMDEIVNEDIFYSRKFGDDWEEAHMLEGVNTLYNEGSACLSKDKQTLYFSRCDSPDGYGNCDLYVAKLQDDGSWGEIKNLGPNINSIAWDSQPSLSITEDTLFFASDRIGGFGMSDIYYSIKTPKGWSKAVNLGPVINTRNSEVSPFFHHKHNVLYFSSNGHYLNFGQFDIYKSRRLTNDLWDEPRNIGPLVNSQESEYYFTIDIDSKYIFYSKSIDQNNDNLDLYSFPLPMGAHPESYTQFSGRVTDDETGEAMSGIVSVIDLDEGVEVAPKFLDNEGRFSFDLIDKRNYLLIIQGEDFFRIEKIFNLDGDTEINEKTSSISRKIKFESIEFENGEANLTGSMYNDLQNIANFMLDHPTFKLKISGHTDSDGNEAFNLKLSQERADNIKDYLVSFGLINEKRIESKGHGSSKPIVNETSEENKKMNRRVEFEIYHPTGEELEEINNILPEENLEDW